jgi:hypothetical protein
VKDAERYKLQWRDHVGLLNTTKDFPRQHIIIAVKRGETSEGQEMVRSALSLETGPGRPITVGAEE